MCSSPKAPLPLILGLSGLELTSQEKIFLTQYPAAGFIFFQRNLQSAAQVQNLIASLQALYASREMPVAFLIDEEGGAVSRLKHLLPSPGEAAFINQDAPSHLAFQEDPEKACEKHYAYISQWLAKLGLNVNCAPVLDVWARETASFLEPRCFSSNPEIVARLGEIAILTMKKHGVLPVMKHLPGHGMAKVDSHQGLPVIEALEESHLRPFQAVAKLCPWAMTSHLSFPSLDPLCPVTFSAKIIQEIIREKIGFQGLLVTDDLASMKALNEFSLRERIHRALDAGHDLALVCDGTPSEWEEAVQDISSLSLEKQRRFLKSFSSLKGA